MRFIKQKIYCDAASTTPLDSRVAKAMKKAMDIFANPSSIYGRGVEAKKVLESARATVARALSVRTSEIIFTSGGTESNNLAIGGIMKSLVLAKAAQSKGGNPFSGLHIITSQIEHSSVLGIIRHFESMGAPVTYLAPDESGIVPAEALRKALRRETALVSIMYANNEIGTIQEISKYGRIVREERSRREKAGEPLSIVFHVDASQAPVFLSLHAEKLGVDMMTLDAHKIYGPKGVGALFVKHGVALDQIIFGGGQEHGLRSTTENIPGIVGLAEALRIASISREKNELRMKEIQKVFVATLAKLVPQAVMNGDSERRLPNNINISIPGIDPEFIVLKLDNEGVECSTKSSCLRGEEESYVVKALARTPSLSRETLRFTFLKYATKNDAKRVVYALRRVLS